MPSEFEVLLLKIDEGFGRVYDKIDSVQDAFVKQVPICAAKFADIDKRISIREAVNGVKGCVEKEKRDWGKWFVRLTMGTMAIGMLTFLWKLLSGGARIVLQ